MKRKSLFFEMENHWPYILHRQYSAIYSNSHCAHSLTVIVLIDSQVRPWVFAVLQVLYVEWCVEFWSHSLGGVQSWSSAGSLPHGGHCKSATLRQTPGPPWSLPDTVYSLMKHCWEFEKQKRWDFEKICHVISVIKEQFVILQQNQAWSVVAMALHWHNQAWSVVAMALRTDATLQPKSIEIQRQHFFSCWLV